MTHPYKILYNLDQDSWNWLGALEDYQTDENWAENIDEYCSEAEKQIAKQIVGLNKNEAEKILKPYLISQKSNQNSKLNNFIKLAEKEFAEKFDKACEILEKITNKTIVSGEFIFYVTTFPRMTIFPEKLITFMYCSTDGVWGMPIDGFLHEGLHYQFIEYWRNDINSPVSKLTDDDFFRLKESLTVILDEELKPIITLPDESYPSLQPLRDKLHTHWKQHHDFEKLVKYGIKIL